VDAQQALADLTEISSQIRSAVLVDAKGAVAASTLGDDQAKRMAEAAGELLSCAERTRPGLGPGTLTQLEVATLEGSVFVVRDRGRVIAATTSPEPTVGLVFYDLKSCLRSAAEGRPTAPAAKRPRPKAADAKADTKAAEAKADEAKAEDAKAEEKPKPVRRRAAKKDPDASA
jgi:predicted regulator of Ras-like GTPase activity (Roadblock/LC7/MglB family)